MAKDDKDEWGPVMDGDSTTSTRPSFAEQYIKSRFKTATEAAGTFWLDPNIVKPPTPSNVSTPGARFCGKCSEWQVSKANHEAELRRQEVRLQARHEQDARQLRQQLAVERGRAVNLSWRLIEAREAARARPKATIPKKMFNKILALVHTDQHQGKSTIADEVTRWLIEKRDTLQES